jgi:crossover junction endodeoxyribonuclease RuvC
VFDPCVIGVDPGIARVGVAAVARRNGAPALLWTATVRTPRELEEASRLRTIADAIRAAIAAHRPESVAIERVAWNRNASSAMAVARATGVILLATAEAGVPAEEYGPLEVKMAITGDGTADKRRVRDALGRVHRVAGVPDQPDAADAVAVALCHLARSRLRGAERASAR